MKNWFLSPNPACRRLLKSAPMAYALWFTLLSVKAQDSRIAATPGDTEMHVASLPETDKPPTGLLDHFRQTFTDNMDRSARWLDGLFSDELTTHGGDGAHGHLRVRVIWQDLQG